MSVLPELSDKQKAAIEAAIRERAVRDGFDPDEHLARYEKSRKAVCNRLLLSEIQKDILGEMHRRGWDVPAELDYEASIIRKEEDWPASIFDGWHTFTVVYGNSEGIYIDWDFHGFCIEKRDTITTRLGSFKTLGDTLGDAEQMGLLAGRLTWLAREIYP